MSEKMAEIIKKASELAQHAPESLRDSAFQKAFDVLMAAEAEHEDGSAPTSATAPKKSGKKKSVRKKTPQSSPPADDDAPSLDDLNRTKHTDISHKGSALNNSLRLILAAKDELGIDGLTGSEIARVLTDKFRLSVTQQGVSAALNNARAYVDRKKEGMKVIFRIMAAGEEYLETVDDTESPAPKRNKAKKKKSKAKKKAAKKKATRKKSPKKKAGNKKASRRSGPMSAVTEAFEDGYFSSPRTVAAVVEHLQHDYGRTLVSKDAARALLRFLRSKKLSRARNEDGQYEYVKR